MSHPRLETDLQALDGSLRMADVLNLPVDKKGDSKVAQASHAPS